MTSTPVPASEPVEPLRLEGKRTIDSLRRERNEAHAQLKDERIRRVEAERKARMYDRLIADIAAAQNQENRA